ncbi:uncharacterized protein CDAR_166051 [Caerostris darwini]|uniref:Uncharacterized protein n=1 Tax=Caerostris darwini TaxID=1538125 RepID=A0AAV4RVI0_9ARAC|nr:uncharacterized protein CDAR_166051 [Caerostris darwini]
MAVNKKFEIFSCNLFYTTWCDLVTENVFIHLYEEEYLSELDDWYCTALDCLSVIVLQMYREYIENTHGEYSSSISDLNSYIVSTCCREDLFGRLPFFDRIFCTAQFVIMLGDFCMERKFFTVEKLFRCVYLSWAMYLDRFSKQFYELGGWEQLKTVAASYRLPSKLIDDLNNRYFQLIVGFYEFLKDFVEFFSEHEPSVRYNGAESFDEIWNIFCFKSLATNIDDIRKIEYLEKFRQLPGILSNLRRLCDSEPSQVVDPMSESAHSVEKTEGDVHDTTEVSQDTIPTPTDFQSSGPKTANSDCVLPSLLDPDSVLSSALKDLQCNEVPGSCKDTSEVKLNKQKDIPNASKRNDPQYAKVEDVNLQHSENEDSRSDKNHAHQAQEECSLQLSNLDGNNYGAALPATTTKVSEKHLENLEQNMEDSKKMDDFRDGSCSKTPCLVESEISNNASVEPSAYIEEQKNKYEEEQKHKEEQKKESESDDVQDMLKMLLVLGDREGVRQVSETLQSTDNSINKKRSKKRNRNRSKK